MGIAGRSAIVCGGSAGPGPATAIVAETGYITGQNIIRDGGQFPGLLRP